VAISRFLILCSAAAVSVFAQSRTFISSDLYKLRSAGGVALSPDGARLAYSVNRNDGAGRPYSQLSILTLADGRSVSFSKEKEPSSGGEWSPDGQWVAYSGKLGDKSGLIVAHPDGSGAKLLSALEWTNNPLPTTGKRFAWSPDSKRLAFVNAVPGPETAEATGDPMVITSTTIGACTSLSPRYRADRSGNSPMARTTSTPSTGPPTAARSHSYPIGNPAKTSSSTTICSP
jgi:Tol biopolymer transport system component